MTCVEWNGRRSAFRLSTLIAPQFPPFRRIISFSTSARTIEEHSGKWDRNRKPRWNDEDAESGGESGGMTNACTAELRRQLGLNNVDDDDDTGASSMVSAPRDGTTKTDDCTDAARHCCRRVTYGVVTNDHEVSEWTTGI